MVVAKMAGKTTPLLVSFWIILLSLSVSGSCSLAVGSGSGSADIAVVGCGVLGTSLCQQLLLSPNFSAPSVTGITKSTNRHESILATIPQTTGGGSFEVKTSQEALLEGKKFKNVVFCAPPSGFDDYPAAVKDAATDLWEGPTGGGVFVFTSSGGIYGPGEDGGTVCESSPTADPETNPRSARLLGAEKECLDRNGCVLRLAGLYTRERGAHSYWLKSGKDVAGREEGIINLLHYDDAASACMAAILAGPSIVESKVFLISDGNPTTRKGICVSAMKDPMYSDKAMPVFNGGSSDSLGKVYDGTVSNTALSWKPKYASFDEFMSMNQK